MRLNAFEPDLAFADVFVPVHARSKSGFRIVHVHHRDAIQSDGSIDVVKRLIQSLRRPNIPARGEQMRGINANSQRQVAASRPQSLSTLQIAPRSCFPAPRYFQAGFADRQASVLAPPASGCCAIGGDRRLLAAVAAAARMKHKIIRAQRSRAHDLLMKCHELTASAARDPATQD